MAEIEKARLKIENQKEDLVCLFNPESFTISKNNTYGDGSKKPAASSGDKSDGTGQSALQREMSERAEANKAKRVQPQKFTATEAATISLTLFFDTTDTGETVTKYTSRILAAMEIDPGLPGTSQIKGNQRPPKVQFVWGSTVSWWAVITSASVAFEFFSSQGTPLRAKVTLNLKQAEADDAFTKQNPTSGTPQPHRVHQVQRGETLDRISARYYGDSTRWRALAAANGVEDPLGLRPGSLLAIPELGV